MPHGDFSIEALDPIKLVGPDAILFRATVKRS
jgi:hypothetical protein